MTSKRKTVQFIACALLLVLEAGCSGINASKSVSPIDFFMPGGGGLMRGLLNVSPPALPSPTNSVVPTIEIPKPTVQVS